MIEEVQKDSCIIDLAAVSVPYFLIRYLETIRISIRFRNQQTHDVVLLVLTDVVEDVRMIRALKCRSLNGSGL